MPATKTPKKRGQSRTLTRLYGLWLFKRLPLFLTEAFKMAMVLLRLAFQILLTILSVSAHEPAAVQTPSFSNPENRLNENDKAERETEGQVPRSGNSALLEGWRILQESNFTNTSIVGSDPKIIGGTSVSGPHLYPFFASITSWDRFICGATLVAPDLLLTAGHCSVAYPIGGGAIVDAWQYEQVTPGAVEVIVIDQLLYPGWTSYLYDDLLLLKISPAVTSITPVELNFDPSIPSAKLPPLTIIGFGYTTDQKSFIPTRLQQASVKEVPYAQCQSIYSQLTSDHICVENANPIRVTCNGDSGGPLLYQRKDGTWLQLGTVSYGMINCSTGPSVFMRLSSHASWLSSSICSFSNSSYAKPSYLKCPRSSKPSGSGSKSIGSGSLLTVVDGSFNGGSDLGVCSSKQKKYHKCFTKTFTFDQAASCVSCVNAANPISNSTASTAHLKCHDFQDVICQAPQRCGCASCVEKVRSFLKCATKCHKCKGPVCKAEGEACVHTKQCCGGGDAIQCYNNVCTMRACNTTGTPCLTSGDCCSNKCRKILVCK